MSRSKTLGGLAGVALLAWGTGGVLAQTPPAAPAVGVPVNAEQINRMPAVGAKPPAVVNGVVITAAELEAALKQAGPVPLQMPEAQRRQHQMETLGMLIDQKLMEQFLARSAVPVTPAEVNQKFAELEAGLKSKNKTIPEFLRETNQTEAQLRANIARNIQLSNYSRTLVTDAKAEAYYRQYKDFFDGVLVRVSHIVLRISPKAPPSEREQARAKLQGLLAQLRAGQIDFAAAAKANSQCPSAANGGDLGFIPRKWVFEEPFSRVAFGLKTGEISDVVETEFGMHLIKVTDRKPGQPSDYAKIKEEVREFCVGDMLAQILAEQRKAAKLEINLP